MTSPPASLHGPGPVSQNTRHNHKHHSEGPLAPVTNRSHPDPRSSSASTTFPFSFIRTSQPKPTSTSIVPSTAEGKAIPVDDSTVENRTTALREFNSHYPSRHRYEKSTGAKSSTYSEPVIVRSYYSPGTVRPANSSGGGVVIHGGPRSNPQSGGSSTSETRGLPFVTTVASTRNGMLSKMGRSHKKTKSNTDVDDGEVKLPPIDAFTFKSFIANIEAQQGPASDINADLDRIAEICAKSRYSLSNQYEVHYAPHGSGASFLGGSPQVHDTQGPTLQVISSDDERSMKRQRRRRNGVRRSSRAVGTLETIMSSSRSSDEERSKKKSASELADEVRGRATRKTSGSESSSISSPDAEQHSAEEAVQPTTPSRRKASLALIDGQAMAPAPPNNPNITPRSSATGLLSELAQPQASTSQLELRTAPEHQKPSALQTTPKRAAAAADDSVATVAKGSISPTDRKAHASGLLSALGGWLPWVADRPSRRSSGRAEGSLRQLLRTTSSTDTKGKGVAVEA